MDINPEPVNLSKAFLLACFLTFSSCRSLEYDLIISKPDHFSGDSRQLTTSNIITIDKTLFEFEVKDIQSESNKLLYETNKRINYKAISKENIRQKNIQLKLNRYDHKLQVIPHYFLVSLLTGGVFLILGGKIVKEKIDTTWETSEMLISERRLFTLYCETEYNIYQPKPIKEYNKEGERFDYGDHCRESILNQLIDRLIADYGN